jgi:hypothetical protein
VKLSCGRCRRFLAVVKVGCHVLEHDERNDPYQLWSADELQCRGCGITTLLYSNSPYSVRGMQTFLVLMNEAKREPATFREVR